MCLKINLYYGKSMVWTSSSQVKHINLLQLSHHCIAMDLYQLAYVF